MITHPAARCPAVRHWPEHSRSCGVAGLDDVGESRYRADSRDELNPILPFRQFAGVCGVSEKREDLGQGTVWPGHEHTGRMSTGCQMIRQMRWHGVGVVSDQDSLLAFSPQQ